MQVSLQGSVFSVVPSGDTVTVDGNSLNWDLAIAPDGSCSIIHDGKHYQARVIAYQPDSKKMTLSFNGRVVELSFKDDSDVLLEKLGMTATAASKVKQLLSPMPGLITEVRVKEGQSVVAGDPLLVLEAMKMENVVKATAPGTVTVIHVQKGDRIEKGSVLIEF